MNFNIRKIYSRRLQAKKEDSKLKKEEKKIKNDDFQFFQGTVIFPNPFKIHLFLFFD